jgi:PPM family protein phosphatase
MSCPECGAPVGAEDKFCEGCGRDLRTDRFTWRSSSAPVTRCTNCGADEFGAEGYCEHCGQRRPSGQERAELELPGVVGVTDRGRHRRHNEDALAIGRIDPDTAVAVVCDGVSTSSRADAAAHAAADSAIIALLDALSDGASAEEATRKAAETAAQAVAALGSVESGHNPPSCTYVSAVVSVREVTIGWIGDSRAYWLGEDPRALTADDSLAGQLSGESEPPPGADPRALALLRWLGADASDTTPHVVTFTPPGPGRVLLCSDGLSKYLPQPRPSNADITTAARDLTQHALDAGGQDNIAVALISYPPV